RQIVFLVLAVCRCTCLAWSEICTSSITGIVTDPSGAVVANAKVIATNEATGVEYNGTTNATGSYTFSSVSPGSYTITVRQAGFQNFTSVHNILTVGTPLVVDAKVKVGA